MIVKYDELFFKRGYELRPITKEQAEELELNNQVYAKIDGVAHPYKITACFENAEKFRVEPL